MVKTTILGVKLTQRVSAAQEFQKVLTEYGCSIKTRLGLHPVTEGVCSPSGVILLEVIGDDATIENMISAIKAIPGTDVQKMEFVH